MVFIKNIKRKQKRTNLIQIFLFFTFIFVSIQFFYRILPKEEENSAENKKYLNQFNTLDSLTNNHEKKWKDWPAIAYEQIGKPLVYKGDTFFNHARELFLEKQETGESLLDEFLEIYKKRPDPVNVCGIRVNHAMALYLAVKYLKPTLVIESGVNQGVSTYFIRAASKATRIFAIDPEEKPICKQGKRWIDSSTLTVNYTGKKFIDILDLNWEEMIQNKNIDPATTLVFIDDHLNTFERIRALRKFDIRHIIVEDNYKKGEGATWNDRNSTPKQMFFQKRSWKKGSWLFNNIISYAEFPPLIPPIMAKKNTEPRKKAGGFMVASDTNLDIVPPILRPDLSTDDMHLFHTIANVLDLDTKLVDRNSYMQFMNYNQFCYLEFPPL